MWIILMKDHCNTNVYIFGNNLDIYLWMRNPDETDSINGVIYYTNFYYTSCSNIQMQTHV